MVYNYFGGGYHQPPKKIPSIKANIFFILKLKLKVEGRLPTLRSKGGDNGSNIQLLEVSNLGDLPKVSVKDLARFWELARICRRIYYDPSRQFKPIKIINTISSSQPNLYGIKLVWLVLTIIFSYEKI